MTLFEQVEKVLADMRNADAASQADAVLTLVSAQLMQVDHDDPWLLGTSAEVITGFLKSLDKR
jgi:hypothetical protein